MAVPTQIVNVPFAGGLAQKTDPNVLAPGNAIALTNCTLSKSGLVQKRFGTKRLGAANAFTNAVKLAKHGNELLVFQGGSSGPTLSAYVPGNGSTPWVEASKVGTGGLLPEVITSRVGLPGIPPPDCADHWSNGTITVLAWIYSDAGATTDSIYYAVYDTVTSSPITPPRLLAAGARPIVFACGTNVVLAYLDGSGGISAATMPQATPVGSGFGASTSLVGGTNIFFDVQSIAGTSNFAIATTTTGGPQIFVVSSALSIVTSGSAYAPLTGNAVLSIIGSTASGYVAVLCAANGGSSYTTHLYVVNATTLATVGSYAGPNLNGTGTIRGSMVFDGSGNLSIVISTATVSGATPIQGQVCTTLFNVSSLAFVATGGSSGVFLHSRLFLHGGRIYAFAFLNSKLSTLSIQGTLYLLDVTVANNGDTTRWVSTIAPTTFRSGNADITQAPCTPMLVSANVVQVAGAVSTTGNKFTGLALITATFASPALWQTESFGALTSVVAGVPSFYDGAATQEMGFAYFPEGVALAGSTTGPGALTTLGTYEYIIVYEKYDGAGQWHQSAPSVAVQIVLTGSQNTVTVTWPNLGITNNPATGANDVAIGIYRTTAGGDVFYRLNPDVSNIPNVLGRTAASTSFTDTIADNVLDVDNAYPYVNGGELPNGCPPSFAFLHTHKGRLWGGGADDQGLLWFTKAISPGVGPSWCDEFVLSFVEPITGVASIDDTLVVFAARGIYLVTGDGPTDAGTSNDYSSTPLEMRANVGAINPLSIVETTNGIYFQSTNGYYLLDRGNQLTYQGKAVENELAAFPTVTSAVVVEDQSQQRMTVSSGSNGETIVYDDVQGQWVAWSYTSDASAAVVIQHAVQHPIYGYVFTDGATIYAEDKTTHLDMGTTWVPKRITTAFIAPNGQQGFGICRRIGMVGEYASDSNWSLALAADNETATFQTSTWTADVLLSLLAAPRLQTSVLVSRFRGTSYQLTFTDAAPTGVGTAVGTGAGTNFFGVYFELGMLTGPRPLASTARG